MMRITHLLLSLSVPLLASSFTPMYQATTRNNVDTHAQDNILHTFKQAGLALTFSLLLSSDVAFAADFPKDISGGDFSGQDLAGKDFSLVNAKKTNFAGANLQGANFAGANLVKADFSGAQLRKANFDDAILDGTIMKDVTAQYSLFSASILDVGDFENADLTDSIWPSKYGD